MDLGIREHLAESDDAAAVIGTLVLPYRHAVARVKISAAGSPPVLIEAPDRLNYPVPSRVRGCMGGSPQSWPRWLKASGGRGEESGSREPATVIREKVQATNDRYTGQQQIPSGVAVACL
jgi:hypothetical protein